MTRRMVFPRHNDSRAVDLPRQAVRELNSAQLHVLAALLALRDTVDCPDAEQVKDWLGCSTLEQIRTALDQLEQEGWIETEVVR